ncbi:MAG: LCP family protein [Coriobacteriia bacterium]
MGKHSGSMLTSGGKGGRDPRDRDAAVRARRAERDRRRGLVESEPELPIHRERRHTALKRTGLAVLALLMVVALAGSAWAYFFMRGVETDMQRAVKADPKVSKALAPKPEPMKPFTVLLIGSDYFGRDSDARADTIILAKVDPATKKVWMISVPRDTRVDIPGHGHGKINVTYKYGGAALTVKTVEQLLGTPVNHYMEVSFRAFKEAVDAMGGIWIDVDLEIDDRKAASFSPGHSAYHIDPGYQKLDGTYALTYVRSRDFPDADFTRMRHQQTFFKALVKQALRVGNWWRLPSMVRVFARYTRTDMSVGEIITLARAMRGMSEGNLQAATLIGEWHSPYIITDETVRANLIQALKTGGDIETTTTPPGARAPQRITVTVRNGAGISGVGKEAASVLEQAGYRVVEVGNANQFVYANTLIVFQHDAPSATMVSRALGVGETVESRGMYAFTTDVLVVVGKDWRTTHPTSTVLPLR